MTSRPFVSIFLILNRSSDSTDTRPFEDITFKQFLYRKKKSYTVCLAQSHGKEKRCSFRLDQKTFVLIPFVKRIIFINIIGFRIIRGLKIVFQADRLTRYTFPRSSLDKIKINSFKYSCSFHYFFFLRYCNGIPLFNSLFDDMYL